MWDGFTSALASDPQGVAMVLSTSIAGTAHRHQMEPSLQTELAWAIELESAWQPSIQNKDTKATGLIQFMPSTAKDLGTTVDALKDMTRSQQAYYVQKYFDRVNRTAVFVGDIYLMLAAPGFVGEPGTTVAYKKGSKAWQQNPLWRPADQGDITAGSIRKVGTPPTAALPGGPIPPTGKVPTKPTTGKTSGDGWGFGLLLLAFAWSQSRGNRGRRR